MLIKRNKIVLKYLIIFRAFKKKIHLFIYFQKQSNTLNVYVHNIILYNINSYNIDYIDSDNIY